MNPGMIRWKIVPLYSGSVVFARVSGWVHSRRPSARSAKFATVFGAWSGNRSTVMSPWLVCRTARRAGEFDSVTPSTLPPAVGGVSGRRCVEQTVRAAGPRCDHHVRRRLAEYLGRDRGRQPRPVGGQDEGGD